jgi:hypothetical protein
MVAQQILGKRRMVEGIGAGRFMSEADRKATLEALKQTSIEEDMQLLDKVTDDIAMASAYQYHIGVKKALANYGEII